MWTERLKNINNFDEAADYIHSQDCFHDYRLGGVEICKNAIRVTIEEDAKTIDNHATQIWDFYFTKIYDLKFSMDCVIPPYIEEMEIENHSVMIGLTNGYISFTAFEMSLGIPKL